MRWRQKNLADEDEREMRGDDESIGGCTAFGWGEGLAFSAIVSIMALALVLILAIVLILALALAQ